MLLRRKVFTKLERARSRRRLCMPPRYYFSRLVDVKILNCQKQFRDIQILDKLFSNSSIIHKEKRKQITTVTVVGMV